MPAPANRLRYVGRVIRPTGPPTVELFASVKGTRDEMKHRFRRHVASRTDFDWGTIPGLTVELSSVSHRKISDPVKGGTVVELFPVHRDGTVEPLPRYEVHVTARGGTWVNRLRKGETG